MIFLLALIVLIVSALTVRIKKKSNSIQYENRKQDGAWMAGKRAYSKAYYIQHNKRMMKTQARIAYKINRKNKLATGNALSKLVHALNPESIKAKCRTWYNKNKASKQIKSRRYSKLKYLQNPEAKKRAREHSAVTYSQNPEPIKQRAREHSAV